MLHWTEHDHALLGQDRKHLLYVMFLEELLLTRDTIVPGAVMSKNGSVSKTKLVLHKWDKKSTLVRVGEDVVAAVVCNDAGHQAPGQPLVVEASPRPDTARVCLEESGESDGDCSLGHAHGTCWLWHNSG